MAEIARLSTTHEMLTRQVSQRRVGSGFRRNSHPEGRDHG